MQQPKDSTNEVNDVVYNNINFTLNKTMLAESVKRALTTANLKPSQIKLVSPNIVRSIIKGNANPTIETISLIETECHTAILDFLDFRRDEIPGAVRDTLAVLEYVLVVLEHLMTQGNITEEDQHNITPLLVRARMMLITNNLSIHTKTIGSNNELSNDKHNVEVVPEIGTTEEPEEGTFFIQHS